MYIKISLRFLALTFSSILKFIQIYATLFKETGFYMIWRLTPKWFQIVLLQCSWKNITTKFIMIYRSIWLITVIDVTQTAVIKWKYRCNYFDPWWVQIDFAQTQNHTSCLLRYNWYYSILRLINGNFQQMSSCGAKDLYISNLLASEIKKKSNLYLDTEPLSQPWDCFRTPLNHSSKTCVFALFLGLSFSQNRQEGYEGTQNVCPCSSLIPSLITWVPGPWRPCPQRPIIVPSCCG